MSARTIKEAHRFLVNSKAEREQRDEETVRSALSILEQQLTEYGPQLNNPTRVVDYLRLRLARKEHEVFAVLFLNSQHQLIAAAEMFRGTLTQADRLELGRQPLDQAARRRVARDRELEQE